MASRAAQDRGSCIDYAVREVFLKVALELRFLTGRREGKDIPSEELPS